MEKPKVHVIGPAAKLVDDVCMKDKQYFIDHPDQDEYTRAYVPGEFVPMPKEWLDHGEPDGVIVRRGPADGMRLRMPFKRLKKEEPKWSDIKNAIQ